MNSFPHELFAVAATYSIGTVFVVFAGRGRGDDVRSRESGIHLGVRFDSWLLEVGSRDHIKDEHRYQILFKERDGGQDSVRSTMAKLYICLSWLTRR